MLQWLAEIRRDLHSHPEPAFSEFRTTKLIKDNLNELGVEIIDLPGLDTGIVGLIHGAGPGPVLGLRADIDALPLQEMNDVPYKSTIDGMMHACGHDAHTAIILGVAKKIIDTGLQAQLNGTVKFIFQPAEETVSGAGRMIELGVLKNPSVNRILAGHMFTDIPTGTIGWFNGPSHAATDKFRLEITGRGTHGGYPHQGRDAILAGANFVMAVQTIISRNISPTDSGVISVGQFEAGTTSNVIPETARIQGTIRSLTAAVREILFRRLQETADGLESMFGVQSRLELVPGVPPNINDSQVSRFLAEVGQHVLGPDKVIELPPTMGGEDFALFTAKVPGALIRIGCGNKSLGKTQPLHSPYFDIDEQSLVYGVEVFYEAVRAYLQAPV
ncbi:MAG: M20 metallopeptidase family protein [Thermodesulfobacteriota bacterium]